MSLWKRLFGIEDEAQKPKPQRGPAPEPVPRPKWSELDPEPPHLPVFEPLSDAELEARLDECGATSLWALRRVAAFAVPGQGGESRLGGMPNLPEGTEWPRVEGSPMTFIGQFDLAEVHQIAPSDDRPTTGLVLLFVHIGVRDGEPDDLEFFPEDSDWAVFFTDEPGPGVPLPDDLARPLRRPEQPIRFVRRPTFPEHLPAAADTDLTAWDAWANGPDGDVPPRATWVDGHPMSHQDFVVSWFDDRSYEEAVSDPSPWRVLLQFDFKYDPDPYGQTAHGYLGVPSDDLAAGRLDRAVLRFQN